jgi:transcriptional regulator with XRE-family HTH domain
MERDFTVNRNIRNIIKEQDKKPTAVADRAGIKRDIFSRIINEKRPVFADEIPLVASALGCSIPELFATDRQMSA